jgi:hypothetical protein
MDFLIGEYTKRPWGNLDKTLIKCGWDNIVVEVTKRKRRRGATEDFGW